MKYVKWSPELISRRLIKKGKHCVSHETIYKWKYLTRFSNHRKHRKYKKLKRELRHSARRQKRGNQQDKRSTIKHRVGIDKRPEVVNDRSRIGDVEIDLMMGSNHKSALLVMTDWTTLVTMIEKMECKNADEINEKMIKRLTRINSSWIKTITYDNGEEFARHYEIADLLNVKTYFTKPYTSQDKGIVENRIGVIRRFYPRKTDLREVT